MAKCQRTPAGEGAVRIAPLGALGAMAYTVGQYGLGTLASTRIVRL